MSDNFYCETLSDKHIREKFFSDFSYKGIMVEVGGGHPDIISTSKHWKENGWRTIIFEPQPKFFELHKNANNEVYNLAISDKCEENIDFHICSDSDGMSSSAIEKRIGIGHEIEVIKVNCSTLNKVLNDLSVNKIDLLNVDTEGWELDVMRGFSPENFGYPLILLENFTHCTSYQEYMNKIGYKLIWNATHNYLYQFEND